MIQQEMDKNVEKQELRKKMKKGKRATSSMTTKQRPRVEERKKR